MIKSIRWRSVLAHSLNLILPKRCLACGLQASAEGAFCVGCETGLPRLARACSRCALPLPAAETASLCGRCIRRPPPQRTAAAVFLYADPVDRLLARLKFSADLAAGAGLAAALAARLNAIDAAAFDALIPLPLHLQREQQRGYNQVSELLRGRAEPWRRRFSPTLLHRVRASGPQSDLSAGQRRRNVRGVFAADSKVAGQRLLLVDDVITTGSTMSEATRCLIAAGAAEVHWLALARAPQRR